MSLARNTTSGILWNFFEQLARRGIQVFVTLALAYFLAPEAFGLVAMMAVFIALGTSLMESGFREALIRMPEVNQADYNTAFVANLGLGLFSYLVLFLAAPLIGGFYEEPQLVLLIRVASLAIIVNAFQVVQRANLSRALNFKAQVKAALPASVIAGVMAIGLAYYDFGVWALIAQMLLAALLQTIFLWIVQGWRPSKDFSPPALKDMYDFGYKLFLSGVLNTIYKNLFVVVIAKYFSVTVAGLYYFANQIKELFINQLVKSLETVTFPALAKIQDNNKLLVNGYKRILISTSLITFPVILFLIVLAPSVFDVLLDEKWSVAATFLQLMCIAALLHPINSLNLNILKVKGRSDLYLWLEIFKKTLAVVTIVIAYRWGVYGLLVGQIFMAILAFIPNSIFSKRLINYGPIEQLSDIKKPASMAVLVSVSAWLAAVCFETSSWLMITIILPSMVLAYFSLVYRFSKPELDFMIDLVKKSKKRGV